MSFGRGFRHGFTLVGKNIAAIVNTVLLSIVYVVGVGLTSLFAKVFGKKFLDTTKRRSYWNKLNLKKQPMNSYYRQF
ncbi:MAG: hypothetical protein OXR66_08750 [Candidatus Woesearchaeota archaeon]|nr:hypothetical protein [Candidatus Woesearchaeota archaeon]